jgi:hypothetical protein
LGPPQGLWAVTVPNLGPDSGSVRSGIPSKDSGVHWAPQARISKPLVSGCPSPGPMCLAASATTLAQLQDGGIWTCLTLAFPGLVSRAPAFFPALLLLLMPDTHTLASILPSESPTVTQVHNPGSFPTLGVHLRGPTQHRKEERGASPSFSHLGLTWRGWTAELDIPVGGLHPQKLGESLSLRKSWSQARGLRTLCLFTLAWG